MTINNQDESNPREWKKILAHEMAEYAINFAFLAMFLIAFAWYRRLVLAAYHIQYVGYLIPLIEAAILAKIIMIGDALHVGRKFQNHAASLTTLYRTIVFSVLVALFSIAEHIIGALTHGKTIADGISEIADKGMYEILASFVMMFAAFLPFFALKEIERAFGAEKVRALFFRKRGAAPES